MFDPVDWWHDTQFADVVPESSPALDYEQQVERMKQSLGSFSRHDHRALTRRIKPSALDVVARKLLETCSPDASEAKIVGALGSFALSRTAQQSVFYTVREIEAQLNAAWRDAAKKVTSR